MAVQLAVLKRMVHAAHAHTQRQRARNGDDTHKTKMRKKGAVAILSDTNKGGERRGRTRDNTSARTTISTDPWVPATRKGEQTTSAKGRALFLFRGSVGGGVERSEGGI
jgi:hypothetical protein